MPDGRRCNHVWRGARFIGRVIDGTPYPAEGAVRPEHLTFRPQAFAAGTFDEEGPVYQSLMAALKFFE